MRQNIRSRIVRRGTDSSVKLDQHRRVVDRTLAWFKQFRHLESRFERHAEIQLAFLNAPASAITSSASSEDGSVRRSKSPLRGNAPYLAPPLRYVDWKLRAEAGLPLVG